jgi:hypothetical protein
MPNVALMDLANVCSNVSCHREHLAINGVTFAVWLPACEYTHLKENEGGEGLDILLDCPLLVVVVASAVNLAHDNLRAMSK